MPGKGGKRPWWPVYMGVNVVNGNLHLELGSGSCVTCGGTGAMGVYPNPRNEKLHGPVLIYNTFDTADTALGSKWMLPYDAHLSVGGGGVVTLTDADGTERVFTPAATDVPQAYTADIEDCTLTNDGTDFTLTRCNGDTWTFPMSGTHANRLMAIASRTTHDIAIARDSNNLITSVTDGFDRVTSFFYVTFGSSITRLAEIREPAPGEAGWFSTFFDYDDEGRLTSITNPVGETTRFTYNEDDQIEKAIDGHGHATTYLYDADKVKSITDPAGHGTDFTYDTSSTTVTNRLVKDTVYDFDGDNRCTKITDALANETELSWKSTTWELEFELGPKIPVSGTPWSRHKIIFTYGTTTATQHELQKLEVKKITNTDSTGTLLAKHEWTYNTEHDVLTYKDPLDHITTLTYIEVSSASIGLVETITNAESELIATYGYATSTDKYRLESYENGVSETWLFGYDSTENGGNSYGNPDSITTPASNETAMLVDVRGRTYQVTDPTGNPVNFVFDDLDRLIQTINPDGTSTRSVYDCCHLMAVVDKNGHGETYVYDELGRRTMVIDANGGETLFEYNDEGWLTKVTDPRGNDTTMTYDDIGRVLEVDYPGGWQEIYTYFEPGMVKSKKSKKSTTETTVNYEYDDLYQLNKRDFPSGTDTTYVVKANGLREKMKDASGEKRYYYDDADRIIKVEQGPTNFTVGSNQHFILEYFWNAASQVTQMKLTVRTKSAITWDYVYLSEGMLDTVTNPDSEATDHQYLTDGRLKKIVLSTGTTREVFYEDTDSSHAYVANKNKHVRKTLDKKSSAHSSTVICSFEYALDAAGIRQAITDKDGKYTKFGYDPLCQLKNENRWSAKTPGTREYQQLFDYDPNGNRTSLHRDGAATNYTIGDNDEMTEAGSADFTLDQFGNTVTKVVGGVTTTYGYDFESHMTTAQDGTTAHNDTHQYDGDGRRMLSQFANATIGNAIRYVHDELTENIIAEFTWSQFTSTYTIRSQNTHGIGLISTNREGTKRYFHFDALGSTAALTDTTEAVQDTYQYSAFGPLEASTGTSVNPFRFVGQWGYYADLARGSSFDLLLLRVRYYAADRGRFLVWDPWRSRNFYRYVGNEPTCAIDPSGRLPIASTLALLLAERPTLDRAGGASYAYVVARPDCRIYGKWCREMCLYYPPRPKTPDATAFQKECLGCCDQLFPHPKPRNKCHLECFGVFTGGPWPFPCDCPPR